MGEGEVNWLYRDTRLIPLDDEEVDEDEDQEDNGLDLQHNQDLLDRHEYLINNPHDPIEQDMPLHQPIPPIAAPHLLKTPRQHKETWCPISH